MARSILYFTLYATRSAPPHIHTYYDQAIGEEGDLEVYPRLDGDLYVNGFANEEGRCRESPNEERIEDEKIQQLRAAMELVYGRPKLDEMKEDNDDYSPTSPPSPRAVEHTQQVCYWPETPDGLPIIGKIPAIEGVYVAGTVHVRRRGTECIRFSWFVCFWCVVLLLCCFAVLTCFSSIFISFFFSLVSFPFFGTNPGLSMEIY